MQGRAGGWAGCVGSHLSCTSQARRGHDACPFGLLECPHPPCAWPAAQPHPPPVPPQFLPFIQGPRNCLGQYFAMLEARVILSLLIKVQSWAAPCPRLLRLLCKAWQGPVPPRAPPTQPRSAVPRPQRFDFTTAFPNAGEVSSTVIPLAPENGMHMLVRDAPTAGGK